ncbi:NADH:flavin oxidoreductase/NADH oxidase [Lentinus tigrinus ALCF2SS1-6]|uniref:NADH:flavin oxidoreductase/NADH oxidase n=1 Tax=Lentinus tigrinus ALCF2SS1-6 TaxID=1328759 RepID=A0A5C2SAS4_9APHY|nr:NADH:flavin oxidoreductase/NADH oxidase [Lentinus tigrinus ALCF2SS1-6]
MPSVPKLFQPAKVGTLDLSNRVVLAPLTRLRADSAHVPTDLMVEYYKQRASYPGTLLVSEATFIAPQAGGMPHVPGIWSEEQVKAWKKVTDAVHAAGSYIYMQLWALGRAARPAALKQESPDFPYVSASPIALSTSPNDVPRELTKDEIKQYVEWYGTAARNAVLGAGFDGVEIHGANGYLVDQFLQDVSNTRTDEYGGSVENRARFALEVVDAVVAAVGPKRTAIRLSPFNGYQDMRMKNPVPQFTYVLEQFKQKYPDLAYIHTVTPNAPLSAMPEDKSVDPDFIYKLWAPRTVITTGAYDRESALKVAEETDQLVGFGRPFLANPDLVYRLRENIPLNAPQEDTFYLPMNERGYTTYPFSEQFLKSQL